MDPRIEELKSKELIGMRIEMSLANNKTSDFQEPKRLKLFLI